MKIINNLKKVLNNNQKNILTRYTRNQNIINKKSNNFLFSNNLNSSIKLFSEKNNLNICNNKNTIINTNIDIDKKISFQNLNSVICRNFSDKIQLNKKLINEKNTFLYNHYRYDGYNDIKNSNYLRNEIVKRENETFKKWKKFLNHYLNDWNKIVDKFSVNYKEDFGEKIGDFIYYEESQELGYDILYRKNIITNKIEIVLDILKVPFLKDINKTILKNLRISPDQKRVSFILDLENNEKHYGGIYDIEKKEFYNVKFDNVNTIEFTKFENYFIITELDQKSRPWVIKGRYLSNKEMEKNTLDKFNNNTINNNNKNLENEIILFQENNENIFIETSPSKDNKFLIINSTSKNDSAIYTLNLTELEAKPIEILKRIKQTRYFLDHINV
jgi:protease II